MRGAPAALWLLFVIYLTQSGGGLQGAGGCTAEFPLKAAKPVRDLRQLV